MKWKFCEFCYINGHCENQDRGHKCECYGKKLEDKCERLEKQLEIAETILRELAYGYQSRNQYNKLIAKANGYFKELEK